MPTREAKSISARPIIIIESTYLVPAGSKIQTIDEVNRPACASSRISNTTTVRSARRTAPKASVDEVPSVDLMTEMAAKGRGRCLRAVARLVRRPVAEAAGRARAAGPFPADRHLRRGAEGPARCAQDRDRLLEDAKKSALVRRALDAAGFSDAEVAP